MVSYAGKLSGDGPEIEGSWQITRDRSGKFLMIRSAGKAAEVEHTQSELV